MRVLLSVLFLMPWPVSIAGAQPDKIYNASDTEVTRPEPLKRVRPEYDEKLRRKGIEGIVKLRVIISKDGNPGDVTVVEGLDPELDLIAIATAKQWRFKPAVLNGSPVAYRSMIELSFRPPKQP